MNRLPAMGPVVRRLVRSAGLDVEPKRPVLIDLLRAHGVDVVLDVGANVGQYARRLRAWGYRGRIVSFEPLPAACQALRRAAARDPRWQVRGHALGDADANATLHVSQASVFSSILPGRPELFAAFHTARQSGTQEIAVRRLDSIFEELPRAEGAVFLKVDTQGYERQVIAGAAHSLRSIAGVQLEISLTPLYEGEGMLVEMLRMMEEHGYALELIKPVVFEPTSHRLLQIDCSFFRPGA